MDFVTPHSRPLGPRGQTKTQVSVEFNLFTIDLLLLRFYLPNFPPLCLDLPEKSNTQSPTGRLRLTSTPPCTVVVPTTTITNLRTSDYVTRAFQASSTLQSTTALSRDTALPECTSILRIVANPEESRCRSMHRIACIARLAR